MSEILSEAVLLSTAGLVGLPLVTRRYRRSFRSGEHAVFNVATLGGGLLLLQAALVVCALPAIAAAAGMSTVDRHFFPGDEVIGWTSAMIATALAVSVWFGYVRFRTREARLYVEPSVGLHEDRGEYELVMLESAHLLAYAHDGPHPQIVITSGLVSVLTPIELEAVLDHELAHLRHLPRGFMAFAAALDPAARFVPFLDRIVDNVRLSVELWADDAVRHPSAARRALIKLSFAEPPNASAAFGAGDIAERVQAFTEHRHSRSRGPTRPMLYATSVAFAATSVGALALFWF